LGVQSWHRGNWFQDEATPLAQNEKFYRYLDALTC